MKRLNRHGESIVEVLIVLVVLGSALTTSFLTTQKATNTNRTALERTAATSFAQTQLERMQSKLLNSGTATQITAVVAQNYAFCLDDINAVQTVTDVTNPQCTASNNLYHSYITQNAQGIYTVTVFWDSASGGQNNVTLVYKPYISWAMPAGSKEGYA